MIDLGGTYRTRTPEETLTAIEPLLWDHFGITRVANITGLDNIGIPTYQSIRPQAKLLTTAQGKGITDSLAKVSAIMESIEGWHCENMPPPALHGSVNQLKQAYPLITLAPSINHGPFEWIDIHSLEIPWGKGVNLLTQQELYFPYTTLNVNTAYYRPGYRYFPPTTNGLASGNTLEEATCHALFELIEREIVADNVRFAQTPQTDLNSITAPHLLALMECIKQSQLELEVWELTRTPWPGVSCFAAVVHDSHDVRHVGMQLGSGAHFSSVVALSRAITEAVQGRATIIAGARDDQYPRMYLKSKQSKPLRLNLFQQAKQHPRPFIATPVPSDFSVCLKQLLLTLKQRGYSEVVLYDHTRDHLNIPVVHALIPGFRYLHGSCFSCPVSLL